MRKLSIAGFLVVLTLVGSVFTGSAAAQRRPNQDRQPRERTLPGLRRGLERREERVLRPQNQKQRIQQRLMQEIGLSADQRLRMEDIRRGHEDDLISAGRRLRQARQALDRVIMSEQFDEGLIKQRAEDLISAQADMIRLQARVRAQVRSVLTSEQVMRFNELERRLRRQMREQRETERQMRLQQGSQNSGESSGLEEVDLASLLIFAR